MKGNNKGPSHFGLLLQSILNGMIGDYLAQHANPLAIKMGLYDQSDRLIFDESLGTQLAEHELSNKVVILAHGLTNLETIWNFRQEPTPRHTAQLVNYGTKLQDEFGYTPFYVRYNTGLPIESNGHQFSEMLQQFQQHYPTDIEELVLVGFSMGGLVLRYAQKHAIDSGEDWVQSLAKCIYIGTPHEGAPLEKIVDIASNVVRKVPLDYVNHWAEWLDIRSQGVKDLRHGLKHSQGKDELGQCGSFYPNAEHYFVSGSIGNEKDSLSGKVFGDTLVRQGSAAPQARPTDSSHTHFASLDHLSLAHSEMVYQQIKQWIIKSPSNTTLKRLSKTEASISPHQKSDSVALTRGVIEVMSATAGKVIGTTEIVHKSISDIPFAILGAIPVLKEVSAPIETLHNGVTGAIYYTLKTGARTARRVSSPNKGDVQ
jgi:pimeloyl-ACP methyl ester carboxylesterase